MRKDTIKLQNTKHTTLLLLFVFLLTAVNSAFGNDATYYGSGVTVYPIKHDNIQLVSEVITITRGTVSAPYDIVHKTGN